MRKLLEENETLTQIVYDAGRPTARPTARTDPQIYISRNFLRKIRLKKLTYVLALFVVEQDYFREAVLCLTKSNHPWCLTIFEFLGDTTSRCFLNGYNICLCSRRPEKKTNDILYSKFPSLFISDLKTEANFFVHFISFIYFYKVDDAKYITAISFRYIKLQ